MNKMIFGFIWDFSETFKIPLGRFAPYVFGQMIGGYKGKKHEFKK